MNPNAILALLGDLYAQLTAAQTRVQELERELAQRPPSSDTPTDAGPAAS